MGEVIDLGSDWSALSSVLSAVVSMAALAVYALTRPADGNDDDDSSPGGGLMQPVA